MIDQMKIQEVFELWLALNETEQLALDAQIRGFVICRAANSGTLKRTPGRPKGARNKRRQVPAEMMEAIK